MSQRGKSLGIGKDTGSFGMEGPKPLKEKPEGTQGPKPGEKRNVKREF